MISSGDNGKTFLFQGKALSKAELIFDTLGDLDELNSFLGLAKCQLKNKEFKNIIEGIQKDLFKLCACLAGAKENFPGELSDKLDKDLVLFQKKVGPINHFVIPGESLVGASLDICRSIVRRAERDVIKLSKNKKVNKDIVIYLNHLSKFLFFFARIVEGG